MCSDVVFEESGVNLASPMVTTCGSGVTAAIVSLAAHLLNKEAPLYDASYMAINSTMVIVCVCL